VDQSSSDFVERGRNRSGNLRFPILDILTHSGDIPDRSLKLSEIAPNFACFWPLISLEGGTPEFLDLHYKEHPYCDHVAKFHGDRPTELGGSPANKKNTSAVKHKAFGTNVPGGLIKHLQIICHNVLEVGTLKP